MGYEASVRMQAGDFEADILADASFSRGLQAVSGGAAAVREWFALPEDAESAIALA